MSRSARRRSTGCGRKICAYKDMLYNIINIAMNAELVYKRFYFVAFASLIIGIPGYITVACFMADTNTGRLAQALLALTGGCGSMLTLFSFFAAIHFIYFFTSPTTAVERSPMIDLYDALVNLHLRKFTGETPDVCPICLEDNERLRVGLIVDLEENVRVSVANDPLVRCKRCSHVLHYICTNTNVWKGGRAGLTCPCCRTPW